jgi:hypothetical protein
MPLNCACCASIARAIRVKPAMNCAAAGDAACRGGKHVLALSLPTPPKPLEDHHHHENRRKEEEAGRGLQNGHRESFVGNERIGEDCVHGQERPFTEILSSSIGRANRRRPGGEYAAVPVSECPKTVGNSRAARGHRLAGRTSAALGQSGLAEREGFEPPIPLRVCRISSAVHSTSSATSPSQHLQDLTDQSSAGVRWPGHAGPIGRSGPRDR